jgi:hypothetical protein
MGNINQTPTTLKLLEQTNPSEYREHMKIKQSAEQLHSKGYEARKKGDYETAIK